MQFSEEMGNDLRNYLLHFYCLALGIFFKTIITGRGIVFFFFFFCSSFGSPRFHLLWSFTACTQRDYFTERRNLDPNIPLQVHVLNSHCTSTMELDGASLVLFKAPKNRFEKLNSNISYQKSGPVTTDNTLTLL